MEITSLVEIERGKNVSLRCPNCRDKAVFHPIGKDLEIQRDHRVVGSRRCPSCSEHVFVVLDTWQNRVHTSYPPCLIEFNSDNIPDKIISVFREALKCTANGCHIASAIMVRRTLEEICNDRGATGGNLKVRLTDLGTRIVLPQELLDAMDELRLLGNDAAHIEAQEYTKISEEELSAAIELTKEIMKGIYQYRSLLGRLRALKTQGTEQGADDQPPATS